MFNDSTTRRAAASDASHRDRLPGADDLFGAIDPLGGGSDEEHPRPGQPDLARNRLRLAQQIQNRAVALHRLPQHTDVGRRSGGGDENDSANLVRMDRNILESGRTDGRIHDAGDLQLQ
jgi:hypothetical protein